MQLVPTTAEVVNLGEMLQLCTGGYYLATPHRVVGVGCESNSNLVLTPTPREASGFHTKLVFNVQI